MHRARILHLCLVFCFALIPACSAEEFGPPERLVIETRQGGMHVFQVELATTRAQQAQGLMHRESMKEDAGMLFIFPSVTELRFWMKNTLIPLDLLFINSDGSIHHIHENAKPLDETGIMSNGPVKAVLEINGGLSEKMNIHPGDVVLHPFFTR